MDKKKKNSIIIIVFSSLLLILTFIVLFTTINRKKKTDKVILKDYEIKEIHTKTEDGYITYDIENDSVYEMDSIDINDVFREDLTK